MKICINIFIILSIFITGCGDTLTDRKNENDDKFKVPIVDKEDPKFRSINRLKVIENGQLEHKIEVNDDSSVTFELMGDDSEFFKFDVPNRKLIFNQTLDFENPKDENGDNIYEVVIKATDSAGNISTQNISVTLIDEADVVPTLSDSSFEITGNSKSSVVGTITPINIGDSAIVSFRLNGKGSENFAISDSGVITINRKILAQSKMMNYALKVTATNSAGDSNTALVNISRKVRTALSFGAIGDGVTDDTAALLVAFGSGENLDLEGKKYLIHYNKQTQGLQPSNNQIIYGNGAEIIIQANNFPSYNIINIYNRSNVIIHDLTVTGDVITHTGTEGEWGFGFKIVNCKNCEFHGCKANKLWGDGYYIAGTTDGGGIYNSSAHANRRQGLSIVSWTNGSVKDSNFTSTGSIKFTSPGYGIDIEPNPNSRDSINVQLVNIITKDNSGGLLLVPQALSTTLSNDSVFNVYINNIKSFNDGNKSHYGVPFRLADSPEDMNIIGNIIIDSYNINMAQNRPYFLWGSLKNTLISVSAINMFVDKTIYPDYNYPKDLKIISNDKISLNKIINYSNGSKTKAPTLKDYKEAGVKWITKDKLELVNQKINSSLTEDVDSVLELNELVKITGYINPAEFGIIAGKVIIDSKKISEMVELAVLNGLDIIYGEGLYTFKNCRPLPRNHVAHPVESTIRKDYKNITISGKNGKTILYGISDNGMDLFNLNFTENLHIKGLKLIAKLLGNNHAGTNGISITGSAKNITIKDCKFKGLPYVDKGNYLDGGKAISIQSGSNNYVVEDILIENNQINNCAYGINWDGTEKIKRFSNVVIKENNIVNCYRGLSFGMYITNKEIKTDKMNLSIINNEILDTQVNYLITLTNVIFKENKIITNHPRIDWIKNDNKISGIKIMGLIDSDFSDNIIKVSRGIASVEYGGKLTTGATRHYSDNNTFTNNYFQCLEPLSGYDLNAINAGGHIANNTFFNGGQLGRVHPLFFKEIYHNNFVDINFNK